MKQKNKKEYLIYKLSDEMKRSTKMDTELFKKLDVKRGLRNEDGTGVLVGLTNIGNVVGYKRDVSGTILPVEDKLFFRGYEVRDLVHAVTREGRFGFEEICFLLLSGRLPNADELQEFRELILDNMPLQHQTILHIIELQGDDIMNILSRSVLEFYTFDENPDDVSRENLMRQSIELISKFPAIIAYAYNMYRHKEHGRSLHIRDAQKGLSLAENFLFMLKGYDYTPLEARTLDVLLILHSEHGGGNNSTFAVRVVSSTGTDTYSAIAAGIGSLKGPKHGGANLKVTGMLSFLKESISDWESDSQIESVIRKILSKEVFDKAGLVYGIGHAIYTVSDPRTILLKEMARDLAVEKGRLKEFEFLERVERVAIETVYAVKGKGKVLCANVDFYSGFVYECIGIPKEIFTPLFAMSRIVGCCAHRNEELNFEGRRIIRPAYRSVGEKQYFTALDKR